MHRQAVALPRSKSVGAVNMPQLEKWREACVARSAPDDEHVKQDWMRRDAEGVVELRLYHRLHGRALTAHEVAAHMKRFAWCREVRLECSERGGIGIDGGERRARCGWQRVRWLQKPCHARHRDRDGLHNVAATVKARRERALRAQAAHRQ